MTRHDGRMNRVPAGACPVCRKRLRVGGEPQPGELTVCTGCATVLIFGPGLALRRFSPAALERLPEGQRRAVHDAQAYVMRAIAERAH